MAGPAYLMYAGSKERERIKNMSPAERAAHVKSLMQFGTAGYLDDEPEPGGLRRKQNQMKKML